MYPVEDLYNDSTIQCIVEASDLDQDDLDYGYQWEILTSGESVLLNEDQSTLVLSHSLAEPYSRVYCIATAQDGSELVSSSTNVELVNRDPVVSELIITPGTGIREGTELTCTASTSDPDLDEIVESYRWTNDGAVLSTERSFVFSAEDGAKGDQLTCTVIVEDSHGQSIQQQESVTVSNTPPEVDGISITPFNPVSSDSLTCNVVASDPDVQDNSSLSYSFVWTVDTIIQSETSNVLSSGYVKDQSVVCTAVVTDIDGASGTASSTAVTILNSTPVVESVSFTETQVYTDDIMSVDVILSDLDDDSLLTTYDWYVDGLLVKSSYGSTLNGSEYFDKDQEILVVVTTNDGYADSLSVASSPVLVLNSPPTMPTVSLGSEYLSVEEDLLCSLVTPSVDIDGDPIRYNFRWERDEQDYDGWTQNVEHFEDGIDNSVIEAGDQWTCFVSATDEIDTTPEMSFSTISTGCPLQHNFTLEDDFYDLFNLPGCWATGYAATIDNPLILPLGTQDTAWWENADWTYLGHGNPDWSSGRFYTSREDYGLLRNIGNGSSIENLGYYESCFYGNCGHPSFNLGWNYLYIEEDGFYLLSGSGYLYLRLTAPIDGECRVELTASGVNYWTGSWDWNPMDVGETNTTTTLLHNHVEVASVVVDGFGANVTIDETLNLAGGDWVDLVLHPNVNVATWTKFSGEINCIYDTDEHE